LLLVLSVIAVHHKVLWMMNAGWGHGVHVFRVMMHHGVVLHRVVLVVLDLCLLTLHLLVVLIMMIEVRMRMLLLMLLMIIVMFALLFK
jgi:hypothetical protein